MCRAADTDRVVSRSEVRRSEGTLGLLAPRCKQVPFPRSIQCHVFFAFLWLLSAISLLTGLKAAWGPYPHEGWQDRDITRSVVEQKHASDEVERRSSLRRL